MFLHPCKDTVAPCVTKQLYFMYALLISVPIINCVNDLKRKKKNSSPKKKCYEFLL